MGIKRLLIDSRIQSVWTVWYGHTKTGPDRRRDEEGAAMGARATPVVAGFAAACAVV